MKKERERVRENEKRAFFRIRQGSSPETTIDLK